MKDRLIKELGFKEYNFGLSLDIQSITIDYLSNGNLDLYGGGHKTDLNMNDPTFDQIKKLVEGLQGV